eukprot:UN21605
MYPVQKYTKPYWKYTSPHLTIDKGFIIHFKRPIKGPPKNLRKGSTVQVQKRRKYSIEKNHKHIPSKISKK